MLQQSLRFFTLYTSVAILLVGHGLQLTVLPLRAEGLGWGTADIGLTGSFYFAGFLLGCWLIPRFIAVVGHIRVFSATTTVCGVALLFIGLTDEVWAWCGLRFMTGLGISGCYIIIESWLNAQSTDTTRGRTLAIYSALVLASMAVGQLAVNLDSPNGIALVIIGGVLLSCSVLPVTLSQVEQPPAPPRVSIDLKPVLQAAPAAMGATLLIGSVTGTLFTLTPVVTVSMGFDISQTSQALVAIVVGGALFQYPAGKLSDLIDRRKVLIGLLVIGALVALPPLFMPLNTLGLLVCFFLLGGVANAIYPICLSHANDRMPGQFLQVGTAILLTNSVGAVAGPTVAAALMQWFGGPTFFIFVLTIMLLAMSWILWCVLRRPLPAPVDSSYVNTVKSTPTLLNLDPREHPNDDG